MKEKTNQEAEKHMLVSLNMKYLSTYVSTQNEYKMLKNIVFWTYAVDVKPFE